MVSSLKIREGSDTLYVVQPSTKSKPRGRVGKDRGNEEKFILTAFL